MDRDTPGRDRESRAAGIVVAAVALSSAMLVGAFILFVVLPVALFLVAFVVLALAAVLPAVILMAVFLRPPVRGSGVEAATQHDVRPFHTVRVSGALTAEIACGQPESVDVVGDDNLLEWVDVSVEESELRVRATAPLAPRAGLTVRVTAPTIDAVASSGAGSILLTGVGNDRLAVTSSGAGRIRLAGQSREAELVLSGSGHVDATELTCESVTVNLTGSADVAVHASVMLSATISGSGRVACYGQPNRVAKQISGSGDVCLK